MLVRWITVGDYCITIGGRHTMAFRMYVFAVRNNRVSVFWRRSFSSRLTLSTRSSSFSWRPFISSPSGRFPLRPVDTSSV